MFSSSTRPPLPLLAAVGIAFVMVAYDVAVVVRGILDGTGGRVLGTLLRDVLLVLGAVLMLRRARWALWLTVALFALSLLRVLAADDWAKLLVNALAIPGIVLTLLPVSRAWVARSEVPASS